MSFIFLKRLAPQNRYEALYCLLAGSMIFLPWIPEISNPSSLLFMFFFFLSMAAWVVGLLVSGKTNRLEVAWMLFVALVGVNFFVAQYNKITSEVWLRSVMPLLALLYVVYIARFYNIKRIQHLLDVLLITCTLWCVVTLSKGEIDLYALLVGGMRITGVDQNFSIPYPFLGALIVLYSSSYSIVMRGALLLFFSLIVIATGYKAQIILLALNFIFCLLVKSSFLSRVVLIFSAVVFMILLRSTMSETVIVAYILQRFESVGGGGDAVRVFEIKQALEMFFSSPILGVGLGADFLVEPGSLELKNYIHNSVFYYLATMGGVGVCALGCLIFSFGSREARNYLMIILSLLASTLTAASYKLIHFNFFLAVLFAVLAIFHKQKVAGQCAQES